MLTPWERFMMTRLGVNLYYSQRRIRHLAKRIDLAAGHLGCKLRNNHRA